MAKKVKVTTKDEFIKALQKIESDTLNEILCEIITDDICEGYSFPEGNAPITKKNLNEFSDGLESALTLSHFTDNVLGRAWKKAKKAKKAKNPKTPKKELKKS